MMSSLSMCICDAAVCTKLDTFMGRLAFEKIYSNDIQKVYSFASLEMYIHIE